VLYLAEVHRHSKGFIGGFETKLNLIACRRNDFSWSVVNNESIDLDRSLDFGNGALVAIDLDINRQIQGKIELASPKIVNILKNFSRLSEKTKDQEQEIEQWKESLAIQSEELSRRQLEMETRLEQVEQMEEEFQQFEQQKQEIAAAKAEAEKIRAEFETKSLELEGAWSQLKGQQQNLEEQLKQAKALSPEQANKIKQQLETVKDAIARCSSLQDGLDLTANAAATQQEILQPHWDNLNQIDQQIESKRQEINTITTQLTQKQQQIASLENSLSHTQEQLTAKLKSLEVKLELTHLLNQQSESQNHMVQLLSGSESDVGSRVNVEKLENIPLPNLESIVANLKQDLEKVARFVSDQEEELGWQCQAVDELEAKIANANEFERLALEQELADEKEAKKMLDQTLIGQRRSLKERHRVLLEHSRILKRRQGTIDLDFESEIQDIDLEPIKQGLLEQQQQLHQQQQELALEVAQIEQSIEELGAELERHTAQKSELESQVTQQQDNSNQLNLNLFQMQFKIDFYQEQLQPLQDALDTINHEISEMRQSIAANTQNHPARALENIERAIDDLTIS
jgi:chromosome segregation ATPase